MSNKILQFDKFKWVYIDKFGKEDFLYLEKNFKFHPLDLKDCQETAQRPKLDLYNDYLFFVFQLPLFDEGGRRVKIRELNIFIGKNYLITSTNEKNNILDDYFYKVKFNDGENLVDNSLKSSSGYLLYKILDLLFKDSLLVIDKIGEYVNRVEEEVYEGKNKLATNNLAIVRRNILNLKRIMEPQINILNKLVHFDRPFLPRSLSVYFDDIHDYLEKMWGILESYKDTIDNLYQTNESFVRQHTEEVIKILTVISVSLLPLTLFASIYGMNIKGLPLADHPSGLWLVFLTMAIFITIIIFISRKKNLI